MPSAPVRQRAAHACVHDIDRSRSRALQLHSRTPAPNSTRPRADWLNLVFACVLPTGLLCKSPHLCLSWILNPRRSQPWWHSWRRWHPGPCRRLPPPPPPRESESGKLLLRKPSQRQGRGAHTTANQAHGFNVLSGTGPCRRALHIARAGPAAAPSNECLWSMRVRVCLCVGISSLELQARGWL